MDKSLMLNELRNHLKIKKDSEFADFLGIRPNTLSNWRNRNTFDPEVILSKCEFVNPRWLLTGEGSMINEQQKAPATAPEYDQIDAKALLEEKERFIQLLLKEHEKYSNIDLAELKDQVDKLDLQLRALLLIVDVDKKKLDVLIKEKAS